ncbi:MAG: hypothetical protein U0Y82_13990 [Thermoleophilia bacterium]
MSLSARHTAPAAAGAERSLPLPPILLVVGAALAVGGLSAPWYRLSLPPGFMTSLVRQLVPNDSTGLFTAGANRIEALNRSGALQVSGWQAFHQIDLIIAGLAAVAVLSLVLTHMRQLHRFPTDTVTAVGAAIVGLVVFRVVHPPGPSEYLHTMWGAWCTLAGGVLVVLGARLAHRP